MVQNFREDRFESITGLPALKWFLIVFQSSFSAESVLIRVWNNLLSLGTAFNTTDHGLHDLKSWRESMVLRSHGLSPFFQAELVLLMLVKIIHNLPGCLVGSILGLMLCSLYMVYFVYFSDVFPSAEAQEEATKVFVDRTHKIKLWIFKSEWR